MNVIAIASTVSLYIVLFTGAGALLWLAAELWGKALNTIAWAFKGTKYMIQYATDAEGRARAKQRVDSRVVVGTPENPYPEVTP